MSANTILYGMQGSLYTAKVRAYLCKQGLPFEERCPGDARFREQILPQTGRWIIPVVQTADGQVLQDGAVILDHFEALGTMPCSATPPDPVLRVLAHLFEMFGGEGLLRPAMHYRWNFDAENLDFLRADFIAGLAPGADAATAAATFEMASGRMRKATRAFGVTPDTIPTVEASYLDFLARFEAHLAQVPYVLGARPSYADYGLIAPLHPHLARDPYPASLMKRVAPRVWRWVERMTATHANVSDYAGPVPDWIDAGGSATLAALLGFIADDYLPEIAAHVEFANAWLASHAGLETGTNGLERPGERAIGRTRFAWRGMELEIAVMPYRLFMLQRVQDAAARLAPEDAQRLQALLSRCGLAPLLQLRSLRRVERRGHLEVWGPLRTNDAAPASTPA